MAGRRRVRRDPPVRPDLPSASRPIRPRYGLVFPQRTKVRTLPPLASADQPVTVPFASVTGADDFSVFCPVVVPPPLSTVSPWSQLTVWAPGPGLLVRV